jgi:serine/threonine protein kinase
MSLIQTIRDYRPIKLLGQGGFGVTYLVIDEAPHRNSRQCVLKQFKPAQTLDSETFKDMQRRFSVEAKALQTLGQQCDQVPKLYDEFSVGGEFYLAQEYVEGKTIAQKIIDTKPFSEPDVRKILISLLSVIHQVHANRMIHRDITPDNIMLRDKDTKPILIDFGAVKEVLYTIVDSKGAPLDISIVIGKRHYMPNEQKLGTPQYESDLYSLGLSAIYMLTGKSPNEFFRDESTMAYKWHKHVPEISTKLRSILDKAIQIDYRDRYRSAQEMLDDLETSNSSVTVTRVLTKEEAARKRAEWERTCKDIERREREAKEAVRLYLEKLEVEFQDDLKRRQAEDAKYKAEIRRKREQGKIPNKQNSYNARQDPQKTPFNSNEPERTQRNFSRIVAMGTVLAVVIAVITKLIGLW